MKRGKVTATTCKQYTPYQCVRTFKRVVVVPRRPRGWTPYQCVKPPYSKIVPIDATSNAVGAAS